MMPERCTAFQTRRCGPCRRDLAVPSSDVGEEPTAAALRAACASLASVGLCGNEGLRSSGFSCRVVEKRGSKNCLG